MKTTSKYGSYIAVGVMSAALAGLGAAAVAGAADSKVAGATTTTAATATAQAGVGAGDHDGRGGGQRSDETVVTGSLAAKLEKAVLAKYAGATIQRIETDADGNGKYEAHISKSDGTQVTAFFDADGAITDTQDGMGGGPAGAPAA